MDSKQKKTRQRNRPRNKANRLKEEIAQTSNSELNATVESVTVKENPVNIVGQQPTPVKECVSENYIERTQSTTSDSQSDKGLRLLQQMMRKKLLQQQQQSEKVNTDTKDTAKIDKSNQKSGANVSKVKESAKTGNVKTGAPKRSLPDNNLHEQSAFVASLQKKLENSVANGSTDLPNTLLENLQKLLHEGPVSDVESSDDEEEYIEYIYRPRQYFLVALCNFCKNELIAETKMPCSRCKLAYYCKSEHMKCDAQHRQICYALQQVADNCAGHIFRKCGEFTAEQFRSYRIVIIRQIESIINRPLTATEQEVILFPRICNNTTCREYDFKKLVDCEHCGQVAYCRDKPEHLNKSHREWCKSYQLFKKLELIQAKFGKVDPSMPMKILRDIPGACCNTKQILSKLDCAVQDDCEFSALSQISTCPLTAWYALKLCGHLKKSEEITVHLIGAEIEFEVDALHKWEVFFLHINPNTKKLNVVFVGPELNPSNVPFEQLSKTKCCRSCRKSQRTVNYRFQNQLYHEYFNLPTFMPPDLICFFNAGLYRYNGFQMEDTWPETIRIATNIKCPIVVTSYTAYEAPLDILRLLQESSRRLNVILPPTLNPFASKKPERNFISDEEAPLMFKNYYCFLVE
uniref:Zinc finger MYND domain-containing protein 17 n=1 Tax=Zeugodacus cucurbitae TaxID=28588 RepID=A0A0A1X0N1_ZEUCU